MPIPSIPVSRSQRLKTHLLTVQKSKYCSEILVRKAEQKSCFEKNKQAGMYKWMADSISSSVVENEGSLIILKIILAALVQTTP